MKTIWISLASLILLILGAAVGWKIYQHNAGADSSSRRSQQSVPVEMALPQKKVMRDIGKLTGTLVPDSSFIVAPRVAGRLEKLLVNLGDTVESGQLIAALDDNEYVQQLARATAELAVAQASVSEALSTLQAAQREYERVESLRQKGIASESEFDQVKSQFEVQKARHQVAAAQVTQKEAALREAEIRQSYTQVRVSWEAGPSKRTVGERFVDEGALLTANTPIVSVLDINTLIAAVYVIERDYARIAVGQAASITTDAYPGETFQGQIIRIAPQLREASRQARVELRVPNPDGRLKPGMYVRVDLLLAEHADATVVPASAIVRRQGQRGVFRADQEGKIARFVAVETGIMSDGLVEIVQPALDGPVIVTGQHLLEDGVTISVASSRGSTGDGRSSTAPAGPGSEGPRP